MTKWTTNVAATCVNNGKKSGNCDICGELVTDVIKSAGSHSWDGGKVTKKPQRMQKA